MLHRRTFLQGMFSAFAAPAIVRIDSIMPVKAERLGQLELLGFDPITGDAVVGLGQMERFREMLLPGLWEITNRYHLESDAKWDRIFHGKG